MNCKLMDPTHQPLCQIANERTQQKRWPLFSKSKGKSKHFDLKHLISVELPKRGSHATLLKELQLCGKLKDLKGGKTHHLNAIESSSNINIYVANTLISMYSKCGSMHDACKVFETMKVRNVVSWTALIVGYVNNGQSSLALDVFHCMDCPPNRVTFAAVLKALANNIGLNKESCLQRAVSIHTLVRKHGFDKDMAVASALVKLFSSLGKMSMARTIFDQMTQHDVISWNVLMLGYIENGQGQAALEVFKTMDCTPNRQSFVAALKACASLVAHQELLMENIVLIHERARELSLEKDLVVASSLVEMYSKSGNMSYAQDTFNYMVNRDVVLWNVLLLGYVDNMLELEALNVFNSMDCVPNRVTFVAALKACASLATGNEIDKKVCLHIGEMVHVRATQHRLDKDVFVASALMNMYNKCGNIDQAQHIFDLLTCRDVVCWNILMQGYAENGQTSVVMDIFNKMDCLPNMLSFVVVLKACASSTNVFEKEKCLQYGVSLHKKATLVGFDKEVAVANTIIDMYVKCGDMQRAHRVFDEMFQRDTVSWNIVMLGYVENDQSDMALELLKRLDCPPNRVTFIAALKACACFSKLETGRMVHYQICKKGLEVDEMVASCLVDFYGKCGDIATSEQIFNALPYHSTISWTALIGGYCCLGLASEVFDLVKEMREAGLEVDKITIQLILATCSHAGLLEEGQRCFETMKKYGVIKTNLEHYTCVIDMLRRANKVEEALTLVQAMPFPHDLWTTIVAASKL